MTKEEIKKLIAGRITDEFRKHKEIDFAEIAASKIYSQWFEFFDLQTSALTKKLEELKEKYDKHLDLMGKHMNHSLSLELQLSESKALVEEKYQIIANYMQTKNEQQSQINTLTEELNTEKLWNKNTTENLADAYGKIESLELAHKQEREILTEAYEELKFHNWHNTKTGLKISELLSPQTKEEISDNTNIVLDNKHEVNTDIIPDNVKAEMYLEKFLLWYHSKQCVNTFAECGNNYIASEYLKYIKPKEEGEGGL